MAGDDLVDLEDPSGKNRKKVDWKKPLVAFLVVLGMVFYLGRIHNDHGTTAPNKEQQQQPLPHALLSDPSSLLNDDEARLKMQEKLSSTEDGIPVGYVRIPRFREDNLPNEDNRKLHVIFSSGCNYFQHWQSELLLASAYFVKQGGRITRIVSGCHDKSAEKVGHRHQTFPPGQNDLLVPFEELNRSVNEDFGLYITPSFPGAKDFPWINKPSSIEHFILHARPELDRVGETIVAILDPDFVFLKPFTQRELPASDLLPPGLSDGVNVAKKGTPVAQHYGLGGGWVHKFPVKDIVGADSHALTYDSNSAAKYFAVGPPLILHADDLTALAPLWSQYMRPVLKHDTDILADMWAYCMASAHLGLHHVILDNYMISTWGNEDQAYPWIDKWPELSCLNPSTPKGFKSPEFIHLASNFKAPESREWMFHKGHVPGKILACDSPLIIESPDDVWTRSKSQNTKQSAWVLCHTVSTLNRVILAYKEKFCPAGYETRKLVRLIQSKTLDQGCNEMKDKWCYPLAQIEGLPKDWRKQ